MKVNAISVQNFSGILKRKTLVDYKEHPGAYDHWYERFEPSTYENFYEQDYYPFKGETKSEIERTISPYKKPDYHNGSVDYNKVIVKQALPVTKRSLLVI